MSNTIEHLFKKERILIRT